MTTSSDSVPPARMRSNPRVPFEMSSERPKLVPPQGKPLIVHVVVNIEYWQFDQRFAAAAALAARLPRDPENRHRARAIRGHLASHYRAATRSP